MRNHRPSDETPRGLMRHPRLTATTDDLGWSAPSTGVDAGTARRGILWQHERIRGFLAKARAVAEARLDGQPSSPDAVASAIGDLRSIMEVHLMFEESVLLPLLRGDLPLGPQRAHQLIDEHVRQRGMLFALHQEALAQPDLPTLATKLAFLASRLLVDMVDEERHLLNADVVRDSVGVTDQTSD